MDLGAVHRFRPPVVTNPVALRHFNSDLFFRVVPLASELLFRFVVNLTSGEGVAQYLQAFTPETTRHEHSSPILGSDI